jgi:DNA-binding NtrC family response regulator
MSGASRILIVDDEPNVRFVFRTALESDGYAVAEAGDGESALAWLGSHAADLVLLDLQMAGLGGMETLLRLRLSGNRTPVVVITAHGSAPDAVSAMKLGAIDFLSKPLTPSDLRNVVADVVKRHSPAEEPAPAEAAVAASAQQRFGEALQSAKRALNGLEFEEAEFFLDRALDLDSNSSEAAQLRKTLRDSRRQHEGPYRVLRDLFPVGRSHKLSQ